MPVRSLRTAFSQIFGVRGHVGQTALLECQLGRALCVVMTIDTETRQRRPKVLVRLTGTACKPGDHEH